MGKGAELDVQQGARRCRLVVYGEDMFRVRLSTHAYVTTMPIVPTCPHRSSTSAARENTTERPLP